MTKLDKLKIELADMILKRDITWSACQCLDSRYFSMTIELGEIKDIIKIKKLHSKIKRKATND